jgi:DNA-binding transcriptional regulator GbsR (MarR family)
MPDTRDHEAISRFVERFAGDLVDAGLPGMPARVFAALLASDDNSLTAAELGETLEASPASISGAVRYLTHVSLIRREREPGSRRHRYRVDGGSWYQSLLQRQQILDRWVDTLAQGATAVGPETPAGQRIAESREFIEFLRGELPKIMERWQAQVDRG